MSGIPQMALFATYSRKDGVALARPPEVTLTMTQIGNLGGQSNRVSANGPVSGAALVGGLGGLVPLRSMSLSTYNVSDIIDEVHLEYGLTGESVDYLQHTQPHQSVRTSDRGMRVEPVNLSPRIAMAIVPRSSPGTTGRLRKPTTVSYRAQ